MQIAQLERACGLPRDTIRYYEKRGLITPPVRSRNNYRQYGEHTLVELKFLRKGQLAGFTLDEMRPAIAHLRAPPEHCTEIVQALVHKRVEVMTRLALEKQRLKEIDRWIDFFGSKCGSVAAEKGTKRC